ncbi:MAG: HAD family phosphatase [Chloroflexota bacterium]
MKRAKISAVIFDMDGLLVESEMYWERARRDFCTSIGCDWTPDDELTVKGANSAEWAQRIRSRCDATESTEAIIRDVTIRMEGLYAERVPLLPGAVSTVRAVAAMYPVAVASSSPATLINHVLNVAGIRGCFTEVVSADSVGRGKPNPDVFLATATKLGVSAGECAVFEDSSAGIAAALAAGMLVIAVPNAQYPASQEMLRRADVVLESLEDFVPTILVP